MDDVKKLLTRHPNLSIRESEDRKCKVVCQLTSHEMPCTMKAIETYINGKKYKFACEHKLTSKEEVLCSQYLIEKRRGQLYCKLTKRCINNLPLHIRQHLNGRRFQKAVNSNMKENPKQQENSLTDKDTEMWVPPDSESESEEIEQLGLEFEEEKSKAECNDEDTYSFDILEGEEKTIAENNTETSSRKQRAKTKLKRSAKHLEKSQKKGKKLENKSKDTPKMKKKRT